MRAGFRTFAFLASIAAAGLTMQAWSESHLSARTSMRWFAAQSPWNLVIGQAATADYSEAALAAYNARGHSVNMNWGSAGVYVVDAGVGTGTTRDLVFSGASRAVQWRISAVPISADLVAAARYRLAQGNTDGMTCVVDRVGQRFLSFWQPRPEGNGIVIRTGGVTPFAGMGWSQVGPKLPSLGRAAGASYCGGLIRTVEMRAGVINHALALAWPKDLIREPHSPFGGVQYPATFSDGTNRTSGAAIPMGARLQLDPSLGDNALRSLGLVRQADLVIAHAMQRYGGYIVDSNSPTMGGSVYFESRYDHGAAVYGATNPWPLALMFHMRFVVPPPNAPLDDASPASELHDAAPAAPLQSSQ